MSTIVPVSMHGQLTCPWADATLTWPSFDDDIGNAVQLHLHTLELWACKHSCARAIGYHAGVADVADHNVVVDPTGVMKHIRQQH